MDPSTKKKMKDKADGEVEKGPNHNSKTKALVMARIIAETNDKADTPVPVLMGELAALKAMKGVTGFGYKNGNAPGEFRILMHGSEYTVDPSYSEKGSNSVNDNVSSVTKLKSFDNLEDLTVAPHYKGIPQGGFTQKINIENGIIMIDGKPAKFDLDFVITSEGKLEIGKGHYHLSGGADKVKGAGQIGVENGKIVYLDNQSGHYTPSMKNTIDIANVLKANDLIGDGFGIFKVF